MINLLASNLKTDIMYARRNRKLLRWCVVLLFVITGNCVLVLAGHFYIASATDRNSMQVVKGRETLKTQKLDETEKRIQNLSNNLKLIVQVLSREVLFSKLLRQIGSVMPAQSVLSSIEIGKLEGGIDLSASAQDYNTATQIQVNLSDPSNKLFDKVDIVSVACSSGGSSKSQYPCNVTLRARFAKDNPFVFISNSQGTKQ